MASSVSDMSDINALLLLLLLRRRRRHRRPSPSRRRRRLTPFYGTTLIRSWIQRRQEQGVYANTHHELNAADPEMFRQYYRLDKEFFKAIFSYGGNCDPEGW